MYRVESGSYALAPNLQRPSSYVDCVGGLALMGAADKSTIVEIKVGEQKFLEPPLHQPGVLPLQPATSV